MPPAARGEVESTFAPTGNEAAKRRTQSEGTPPPGCASARSWEARGGHGRYSYSLG